jgi:hypothetical protein
MKHLSARGLRFHAALVSTVMLGMPLLTAQAQQAPANQADQPESGLAEIPALADAS